MRTPALLLSLTTALFLSLAAANKSQAYDGGCGYGYGYGIGFLYNSLEYRVPYFAAHPPVYYSHPVPRTYGYSPFAYPPHFRTPDVVAPVQPVMVSNPFVPKAIKTKKSDKPTERSVSHPQADKAAEPQVIENPFVVDTKLVHSAR
ncbi:MAG: hypothetical protein ACR2NU_04790 [Aeoliella sp.]